MVNANQQYKNIPRTIQNVFLNSKLEADFIKQTIIWSMSDNDISIDLDRYSHHLKEFETQLNDIKRFRYPSVRKHADILINKEKSCGAATETILICLALHPD